MPNFIDAITIIPPGSTTPVFWVDLNGNFYTKGQVSTPTGQDLFENGTAALPAMAFIANPNRGIYNDTTNSAIGFSVGGAEIAYISATAVNLASATILSWAADVQLSRGSSTAILVGNATDSNNRVDLGATASPIRSVYVGTSVNIGVTTNKTGALYIGANASLAMTMDVAGTSQTNIFNFTNSNGTQAARTDSVSGDSIGTLQSNAWSTSLFNVARIGFFVDGTFTTGQAPPSRIDFLTNVANASPSVQMKLDAGGNLVKNLTGADLAQGATVGFIHLPGCATGKPNGTPSPLYTGSYPLVWDHVGKKLSVYDGGWLQTAQLT